MMTRGPKPDSDAMRRLKGQPDQRKRDMGNVTPIRAEVEAPATLDDVGRKVWYDVSQRLRSLEILTDLDLIDLEAYCLAVQNLRAAQAEVNRDGPTLKTRHSTIKHPGLTVIAEATRQINQHGSNLGLNPAARVRLLPAVKEKAPDSFDDVGA